MSHDLQDWNRRIVTEFRANGGFVPWSTEDELAAGRPVPPLLPGFERERGVPIMLVGHTGARTGRHHTTPLMYQVVNDSFAVFASFGGSPRTPSWYRNIEKNPDVTIEVGTEVSRAVARVAEGAERERVWGEQVRVIPEFADFERIAGRRIPVVVLDPVRGAAAVEPPQGG
ncbi:nitroreductase family deazaflavin-dependent oxidoreductase [Streptomyces sp. AJS327]|uniref:nitroreductase/quinone reductase family protein n=1 Tax=Streptomyces sp. AJS327 TaxID=2545265 RepID=UPI0015DFB9B2|nr:nitroreductase/quinone reductase family protein [Streptomyces sp. AJS327]MBA0053201.1 nitroreductase family deazaflavin-dependent oxidoreductase [Streptomyces sp. AJS327]